MQCVWQKHIGNRHIGPERSLLLYVAHPPITYKPINKMLQCARHFANAVHNMSPPNC